MSAIENVFWGVVAGIITSGLLFVCGVLIAKLVLPWYQALIYRGVDLRGAWLGEKLDPTGVKYRYEVMLEQNAHDLKGTATISKTGSNHDYVQKFSVEGSTWEGFVTLTFKSTDRTRLSFAAGLVKVLDRGQTLEGHWAYRAFQSDRVETESIRWSRTT